MDLLKIMLDTLENQSVIKKCFIIKIKYGNDHRRTTVKWDCDNPKWNESFLFENILYKYIEFEICDCDKWFKTKFWRRYKYKNRL